MLRGNNVIELNIATMREAMAYWLNNVVMKNSGQAVQVISVEENTHAYNTAFKITFTPVGGDQND